MKVSLTSIINEVIGDSKAMSDRTLLRRFYKLVAVSGGNIERLKDERGHIFFEEEDTMFIKTLLEELYMNEGIASKFIDKQVGEDYVGYADLHSFVQKYLKNLSDSGSSEEEIQGTLNFLCMLFLLPVKENLYESHRLIDYIFLNLEQYPYTHQAIMSEKVYSEIQRMFAHTMVEGMLNLSELCSFISAGQDLADSKNPFDWYGDDQVGLEYRERDRRAYRRLVEDDELREFVEKRAGAKINQIFPEPAREAKEE